jgi:hypothetical protein
MIHWCWEHPDVFILILIVPTADNELKVRWLTAAGSQPQLSQHHQQMANWKLARSLSTVLDVTAE